MFITAAVIGVIAAFAQNQGGNQGVPPTSCGLTGTTAGHIRVACPATNAAIAITNAALDANSTDVAGGFTVNSGQTTAVLTFGAQFGGLPPWCLISPAAAVTQPAYTVTVQSITFSSLTASDRYIYHCLAQPAG